MIAKSISYRQSGIWFCSSLLFLCWVGCSAPELPSTNNNTGSAGSGAADAPASVAIPDLATLPIVARSADFDSPAATTGTMAGEVRELTPLRIPFCWCPAGTFTMGTADDAPDSLMNEVQTDVTLTKGFWMQQTEVTQAQYEAIMGINPSHFSGTDHPVESVSWTDAVQFCERLSSLSCEQAAGHVFRLPTEAEWEYACRAGTSTSFSFGDDPELIGEFAWYKENSSGTTHPVAQKQPNLWNLFDMHGNVAEWCQDWYGSYAGSPVTDPTGPETGEQRILRGGGWFFVAMFHRSAYRDASIPSSVYVGRGFRLAVSPVE